MKPKTVRRVKSEQDSQTRAYSMHAGIVAGSIIFTSDGEIPGAMTESGVWAV